MDDESLVSFSSPLAEMPNEITNQFRFQIIACEGRWLNSGMSEVCPIITKWGIKQIYLSKNNYPTILKQINSIRFEHLELISLSENSIASIQSFERMFLPALEILHISSNFISKISALRKASCPSLKNIFISANYINQFSALSEMEMPELRFLIVQFHDFHQQQCYDVRCILKTNTTQLGSFEINSSKRMQQHPVLPLFTKKWKGIRMRISHQSSF